MTTKSIKFLTQKEAIAIDEELMNAEVQGFSVDQLMELAGMSVSHAVVKEFPSPASRILVAVGPGNNGGDALVAARHLRQFGYKSIVILLPKTPSKQLYQRLVLQCQKLDLKFIATVPSKEDLQQQFDVVLDGIFGFSFKSGEIRSPYDVILSTLNASKVPIIAIDIPSGWDVEKGNEAGTGLNANVLVSLTAPKLCAKYFQGSHYLGGRFVPPEMVERFGLNIPEYPGTDIVMKISD